jgi:hypothetical protein
MFSTAHLTRTVIIAAAVSSLAAAPAFAMPAEPPLSAAPHVAKTTWPPGRQHGTPPRVEGMGVQPERPASDSAGPVVPLTKAADSDHRDRLIAGILTASTLALALIVVTARRRRDPHGAAPVNAEHPSAPPTTLRPGAGPPAKRTS